jgi:DNA-binding NarL/FixJ family response regulator
MRKSAVYLLAENRLLREALIRLLSKRSDVRVVGASAYSQSVHREIIAASPQIILMDSSGWLKDTRPSLISTLCSALRNLRIMMVDMEPEEQAFLDAVRAGVVGYVLKNASAMEVAAAIGSVAAGKAVCPPTLCLVLFRCVMHQSAPQQSTAWGYDLGLSRREQETLELLRYRYTNKEIAVRLNLSEQTVKNHVHRILRKLGLPNRFSVPEFYEHKQTENHSGKIANSSPKNVPARSTRESDLNSGDGSIVSPLQSPIDTLNESSR